MFYHLSVQRVEDREDHQIVYLLQVLGEFTSFFNYIDKIIDDSIF